MDSKRAYVLVHFWPTAGGFKKRMEMLLEVLARRCRVTRIQGLGAFLGFLWRPQSDENPVSVLVYGSLAALPLIPLRLLHSRVPVYYMIRGDEATYARQAGHAIQARFSLLCQRIMKGLGCHFVFVCEDLRALFEERLGAFKHSSILPNTIGRPMPSIRDFEGRIALVGNFGTVKNTEWAIERLSRGEHEVDLYGADRVPDEWRRPWLNCRGVVADLTRELTQRPALVLLPYVDAGFPNVVVEALLAGCPVAVHERFPFRHLPVHDAWRFSLSGNGVDSSDKGPSELESFLGRLREQRRDFRRDNPELMQIVESDWEQRVWDILG
ncbi:MAG: hypothetical protein ABFE01_06745 [Phycisphaerales bacterium]